MPDHTAQGWRAGRSGERIRCYVQCQARFLVEGRRQSFGARTGMGRTEKTLRSPADLGEPEENVRSMGRALSGTWDLGHEAGLEPSLTQVSKRQGAP